MLFLFWEVNNNLDAFPGYKLLSAENNDGLLFNYTLIMNICLENCAPSVKMKQNETGKIAI